MLAQLRFIAQYVNARFVKTERGATAVEYGLMVSLIAVAIIAIVATLGGHLHDMFDNVDKKIDTTP